MLFLHFRLGDDHVALAAEQILEIVPLFALKAIRGAPAAVVGSFEYRGRYLPVVDLYMVGLGRTAHRRLGTRIIVARHPANKTVLVGLIAEGATDVSDLAPEAFAPFALGPQGLVQRVTIEDLLPTALLSYLSDRVAA